MKKPLPFDETWAGEINDKLGYRLLLKTKRIVYRGGSRYNPLILLVDTEPFGLTLILGDEKETTLQYTEKYSIYDEMLSHVPMSIHPKPENVLIIGGGDGAIVKNVLMYTTVKKIHLVEIDEKVVEISKKYFEHAYVFEDDRVEIFYQDGAEFVKTVNEKYDVIIGDYTDPYPGSPASSLISENFYSNIDKILKEPGILAVQAGSPIYQTEIFKSILKNLKSAFKDVRVYYSPTPIYPGGLWCYALALKGITDIEPKNRPNGELEYYNFDVHIQSFHLPEIKKKHI